MSESKTVSFVQDVPVRHEVDVAVAGGGPAGVAAAVAAARGGMKVFLAEGSSCLGGMGTSGLVPAFMQFGDGVNFCAGGVGREILQRLRQAGGTGPEDDPDDYKTAHAAIKVEVLKRVYDELLQQAGVDFAFGTNLIAVQSRADRVTSVLCAAKSGLFAVTARFHIDATGDGDLCAWAGAPFEKGDAEGNMMPGTLCSLWAGVDWPTVRSSGLGWGNKKLEEAFKDKVFTHEDRHLPGMWRVSDTVGGGNIGHTFGVDGTDERSITQALIWGRKLVLEYERYYKHYLKGFELMELVTTAAMLGLRESRRIMGDYVLCLDDFKQRAVFDDEIGRYSYPVDIHASKPDAAAFARFMDEWRNLRYGPGENYGIPYRCLLPKVLSNVFVAGRCLSADRYMQGTIRTMPGCYITGQAAGAAAALAVKDKTDTRGVDIAKLQRRLLDLGAFLPNAKT